MRLATVVSIVTAHVAGIIIILLCNSTDAHLVVGHANRNQNEALRIYDSITDPFITNDSESEIGGMQASVKGTTLIESSASTSSEHPGNEQEPRTSPNQHPLVKQHQSDSHIGLRSEENADEDGDGVAMKKREPADPVSCPSQSLCGCLDDAIIDAGPIADEICTSDKGSTKSDENNAFIVECGKKRFGVRECDPPPEPSPIFEQGSFGMSFMDALIFIVIFISMIAANSLLVLGILRVMETIDKRWLSGEESNKSD